MKIRYSKNPLHTVIFTKYPFTPYERTGCYYRLKRGFWIFHIDDAYFHKHGTATNEKDLRKKIRKAFEDFLKGPSYDTSM